MDSRFAVTGVDAFTPLAQAAPALLLAKAKPLFELESAAASGADMDAVHDMRVASRRLRETMRLLEPLYPGKDFCVLYKQVRHITRVLGPVRDADVFIDAFARLGRELGEGGKRAVAFLVGRRMGVREHQLVVLERELAELDLAQMRRAMRKLAPCGAKSAQTARTLASFAHAEVAQRSAVVFGALPAAMPQASTAEQHALRIDFKRLRYAVEVFAPVYDDRFDELHDTLTAFQDTLGDLHDIHLFLDLVAGQETARAAEQAGVAAPDLQQVTEVLRKHAQARYEAFVALVAEHPAQELLPELLLPLSRPPEPSAPEESAPLAPSPTRQEELPAAPAPAATPPSPAVVLEPPTPVSPDMPAIDPAAQPWRSDAAGLSIEPPVVIGAEPWARAKPATLSALEADSDSASPDARERLASELVNGSADTAGERP